VLPRASCISNTKILWGDIMMHFGGARRAVMPSTFPHRNIWLKMPAESWTGLSRTRAYGQTHRDTVAFDDADGLDQIGGMRHIELRRVDVNISSSAFSSQQFLFVMSTIYSFVHPSPRERTSRPCIYAIHPSSWLHDPSSTYAAAAVPAAAVVVAKMN
jgi:hypothetical protein